MGITKFNKTNALFINNEKFDKFFTLEELFNQNGANAKYKVTGLYTYKSTYGEGCFIKSNGFNISLPSHLVKTINEVREDNESVEEINNGIVYVMVYQYQLEKYPHKNLYSINWVTE